MPRAGGNKVDDGPPGRPSSNAHGRLRAGQRESGKRHSGRQPPPTVVPMRRFRDAKKAATSAAATAAVKAPSVPHATAVVAFARKNAVNPHRPTTKPRARRATESAP